MNEQQSRLINSEVSVVWDLNREEWDAVARECKPVFLSRIEIAVTSGFFATAVAIFIGLVVTILSLIGVNTPGIGTTLGVLAAVWVGTFLVTSLVIWSVDFFENLFAIRPKVGETPHCVVSTEGLMVGNRFYFWNKREDRRWHPYAFHHAFAMFDPTSKDTGVSALQVWVTHWFGLKRMVVPVPKDRHREATRLISNLNKYIKHAPPAETIPFPVPQASSSQKYTA
ncbi:MAG TPA: hypothetical protein PLL06_12835 [Acidobacteriota bacterium]|nr:hypothetical protein [Acidobacteriota bacterium]HNG91664.1 hypothetical protein [Acidobacteriota bacterium]HNH81540.1 hypothetical protein [Acidobacteriota bacterium]HNJ43034.1 hypothetical protein [Acidobacteriota bacterium]